MITAGVVLVLIGWILNIGVLYTLGAVLAVVGLALWLIGAIGGRYQYRYW